MATIIPGDKLGGCHLFFSKKMDPLFLLKEYPPGEFGSKALRALPEEFYFKPPRPLPIIMQSSGVEDVLTTFLLYPPPRGRTEFPL
jgi:hypothetical protein